MRRVAALLLAALALIPCAGATTIARVTLPQMERSSTVVFVGTFVAADRTDLGGLTGSRYRFRVERFLRGGPATTVHLSVPSFPGLELGVEQGERYLVFAERRPFGPAREQRLTATGYYQGVYRMLGDLRAVNEHNGSVTLQRLADRLED